MNLTYRLTNYATNKFPKFVPEFITQFKTMAYGNKKTARITSTIICKTLQPTKHRNGQQLTALLNYLRCCCYFNSELLLKMYVVA